METRKVVIIGAGNVGMSYAYSLLNQKTSVNELVIIDNNYDKAVGNVMDLNHGLTFAPTKMDIKAGTYSDVKDAEIVCIAAGANQLVGETRLDLVDKNAKIFKEIVSNVIANGFDGIFLIATNPVDIMTYLTFKYSNFPKEKVIGTGTTLDTARLRYLIGEHVNINSKNIHAYIIGEHGDSEFPLWSEAVIGSKHISEYIPDVNILNNICEQVKTAAYEIIKRKQATYYGIGMCLTRITNAILNDENTILTTSSYLEDKDIYIGMPSIINRNGYRETVNINMNDLEKEQLNKSINIIKDVIDNIKN